MPVRRRERQAAGGAITALLLAAVFGCGGRPDPPAHPCPRCTADQPSHPYGQSAAGAQRRHQAAALLGRGRRRHSVSGDGCWGCPALHAARRAHAERTQPTAPLHLNARSAALPPACVQAAGAQPARAPGRAGRGLADFLGHRRGPDLQPRCAGAGPGSPHSSFPLRQRAPCRRTPAPHHPAAQRGVAALPPRWPTHLLLLLLQPRRWRCVRLTSATFPTSPLSRTMIAPQRRCRYVRSRAVRGAGAGARCLHACPSTLRKALPLSLAAVAALVRCWLTLSSLPSCRRAAPAAPAAGGRQGWRRALQHGAVGRSWRAQCGSVAAAAQEPHARVAACLRPAAPAAQHASWCRSRPSRGPAPKAGLPTLLPSVHTRWRCGAWWRTSQPTGGGAHRWVGLVSWARGGTRPWESGTAWCQLQLRLAWWAEGSPRALQRRPPVPCTDQHYPRPGPLQAQPELFAATLAAGGQGKAAVEQQEFLESSMALMQVRAVACRQG